MRVAILRQGDYLIASIQSDLTDSRGRWRCARSSPSASAASACRGLIVDVGALDVIDSFVARALTRRSPTTARLRGAETVIVGIQPDVAIAMVHFDLDLQPLRTALDLDEGSRSSTASTGRRPGWAMRCACRIASDADSCRRGPRRERSPSASGSRRTDATLIATAVSEIARNIVVHVGLGEIVMTAARRGPPARASGRRIRRGPGHPRRRRRRSSTATRPAAASGSACPARAGSWTSSRSTRTDSGTTGDHDQVADPRRARASPRGPRADAPPGETAAG